jgi:hypothetical protein
MILICKDFTNSNFRVKSELLVQMDGMASSTGKFNPEPNYFKEFEFSRQKKMCILPFCHFNRTNSWFDSFSCLNNANEKLILKRIGGNFELIEILLQLLIKKRGFLKIIYLYRRAW